MNGILNYRLNRSHWTLLTGLFAVASFLEIVLFSHLSAFTPLFLQNLGFDAVAVKFWTGILASVGMLLGLWFVPFWGVLAERYGRKALIIRSFVIELVAVFIMALSSNLWVFMFGRAFIGLALGNTGLMFASITNRCPRERVGTAISFVTGAQPLGGVIGALIGGFLVSRFGVQFLWGLDGVMIAAVVLLLARLHDEPFTPVPTPPLKTMLRDSLNAVVKTPHISQLFAFSFLATAGYFFSYAYVSNRILELIGTEDAGSTIGLVFGVAGLGTLIATPAWGALADRFSQRRLLPIVTLFAALLYIPLYFASNVVQFTFQYFLLASVSPAINSLTFALIGLETPADKRNYVMSMIYLPLNTAILIGPLLASFLTSEVRQVFIGSSAFVFAAFVFLLFMNRWSQQPVPSKA